MISWPGPTGDKKARGQHHAEQRQFRRRENEMKACYDTLWATRGSVGEIYRAMVSAQSKGRF